MSKVTFQVVSVSPTQARQWLEKNHPDNRRVSQKRVDAICADIISGAWRITHQAICFDKDGMLIDGQHRLRAVEQSKRTVKMAIAVNDGAKFDDPIDRGDGRSIALVTGLSPRLVSALGIVWRMENGLLAKNVSVTVDQVLKTNDRHKDAVDAIAQSDEVQQSKIIAGLGGAAIWTMPIHTEKTLDFLSKVLSGEMIKRGDPAFAFRNWHNSERRFTANEVAFASLNCLRHHIQDKQLKGVYTGEMGYRAACGKRRHMRIDHTPDADTVRGVSWTVPERPTAEVEDNS